MENGTGLEHLNRSQGMGAVLTLRITKFRCENENDIDRYLIKY